MRHPLPDLMASVAKHRGRQIQKLQTNSICREKLVRLGAVPVPVPPLRDFSDGREAFDTFAAEEHLCLEIDVSAGQARRSDKTSSSSNQSLSGSERIADVSMDSTPSFIGTEDAYDFLQKLPTVHVSDHAASKADLEQYAEPMSVGPTGKALLPNQASWGHSHAMSSDEGTAWLSWDRIFGLEGVP
jgi:hypothetical protein